MQSTCHFPCSSFLISWFLFRILKTSCLIRYYNSFKCCAQFQGITAARLYWIDNQKVITSENFYRHFYLIVYNILSRYHLSFQMEASDGKALVRTDSCQVASGNSHN